MNITRRGFLKLSGGTLAAAGIGASVGVKPALAQPLKVRYAKEVPTICPYCAVGCGIIAHVRNGKVINTEGDPNHPINRGSLCSKGSALYQIPNNDKRLNKVLYRAPGAGAWKEVSWEWALDKIAQNVKKTRDKGFIKKNSKGQIVNRVENIASLGGAGLDNEEVYSLVKFKRALGLVYLEHQARI
jgi:formate dehydrogenase major subunit